MDVIRKVKEIENEIINWRRELHKVPELGMDLPLTTKFIKEVLDKENIPYETILDGSAIVALIKSGVEGKTLAIRADMDGLKIKEDTNLPYQSTTGNMHACGHDGHTAMALGAAKILNNNKDKFKGNVKILFQPAEESPGGAKPMIEAGVLKNPDVDGIIGLHAGKISEEIPGGSIGVGYDRLLALADLFTIKLIGKGGHGAYPEDTVDPIIMAIDVINSIQNIKTRQINAFEPVVISICSINGGTNRNAIANELEIGGTVRTFSEDVRDNIVKQIEKICKGVTDIYGGSYVLDYECLYPPVINDKEFTEDFVKSARKILDDKEIVEVKYPVMGGEDMSFFLKEVPGTFFFLSNIGKIDGVSYNNHHPKFELDESQFYKGTSLFVQFALDYLN